MGESTICEHTPLDPEGRLEEFKNRRGDVLEPVSIKTRPLKIDYALGMLLPSLFKQRRIYGSMTTSQNGL